MHQSCERFWFVHAARQVFVLALAVTILAGCRGNRGSTRGPQSPVRAGLNTNNLLDVAGQAEADALGSGSASFEAAERLKRKPTAEQVARRRSILCLSGGGSYGAYSAGVLCGWTTSGDRPGCNGRPNFSVVTGISTGALIAPYAFLGPKYDNEIRKFYTTIDERDVYRLRPVRGLFGSALADTGPLACLIDQAVTPQLMQEVAEEHRKGRRLYIGTTELEGGRFVCWDLGEIACRNQPGDRELIKQILLGSSAIPGFFPPSRIPVTVNGKPFVEEHGDGGTSMSIFFRPPYVPPEERSTDSTDLAGVDLYLLVAGKLYADAAPIRPRSIFFGTRSVSTVLYAQTRGDLQRLYLVSVLSGMNYRLAAIPDEYPAPESATDFNPAAMTALFKEGYGLAAFGAGWRDRPPGTGVGESTLQRGSTNLTEVPRGPSRVAQ